MLALVEVADANLLDQFVLGRITNAPDDQATQAHIVLPYLDGAALGGGMKAGVTLGVIVAILSPVIGNLYQYYSVTYLPVGLAFTDSIFHLIAHAIEGGVAGLIYKDIGRL